MPSRLRPFARGFFNTALLLAHQSSFGESVAQAQPNVISLDPRATYLRTNDDVGALPAQLIDLATLGLSPGDIVRIQRVGDYDVGSDFADDLTGAVGVFSSTNVLLPASQSNRVPGAIDTGVDVVTRNTFHGDLSTDIAEDFLIDGQDFGGPLGPNVVLEIPAGAAYLFVAAHDVLYEDNSDPDADFAIVIELASESIAIDPRATYLRTNNDPNALPAQPIELGSLGLAPGDMIRIRRVGDFDVDVGATYSDDLTGTIGVFSATDVLLAANQANRVPDAIDAGFDVVTRNTHHGNLSTDISADFSIDDQAFGGPIGPDVVLGIPAGATHLFVAAHDVLYGDNSDPDADFAIVIPEPHSLMQVIAGVAAAFMLTARLRGSISSRGSSARR